MADTIKLFDVLNGQGKVGLVEYMGTESSILDAARTSYGKGTKPMSDDVTLMRYLMRHRHTTPFEMCELKFVVYCPMDVWRQWIRHRTASVNEYSTRYSEAIDDRLTTPSDKWRVQSTANKQGSAGYLTNWPDGTVINPLRDLDANDIGWRIKVPNQREFEHYTDGPSPQTPGEFLTVEEGKLHDYSMEIYNERLALGVAREQARKDLPLSTFTKAYWKVNLHNLLHFLSLRMDSHAQSEIREYATVMGEQIVQPLYPNVWQAFLDYRLNAMTLSGPEVNLLKSFLIEQGLALEGFRPAMSKPIDKPDRERSEFHAKLERLGL